MPRLKPKNVCYLYILECKDKSLYTGITKNLEERVAKHKSGKAAKYTRSRGVRRLVFSEKHKSWSSALKREWAIKKLDRSAKLGLVRKYLLRNMLRNK